jgi:hypothetical protein
MRQVVQALIKAADHDIQYGHVKASNVFLSHTEPDLLIQLGTFEPPIG